MQNREERLNKFLALRLGVSRREADDMILSNSVKVNDKPSVIGQKVVEGDVVSIGDKVVETKHRYRYFILNKPLGYVCSRKSQGDSPTIYQILPEFLNRYKTVGRLDKNSSGLIILTNDGDFSHSMTHPKFSKNKTYEVSLDKNLEPLHHQMIADFGVTLNDGISKFQLHKIDSDQKSWLVTMHEGRNRQIRRTFQALGYKVVKLNRIGFGPYKLGNIKPGKFEEFTVNKVSNML